MNLPSHASARKSTDHSQLSHVIQNLDFLARLECRETKVRAACTAESISKGTAATGTSLALHSKVKLVQVVLIQLQHVQILISVSATLLILRLESIG